MTSITPNEDPRDGDSQSYPRTADDATLPLEEVILNEIEKHGAIPFSQFMQSALYDPHHGYYTKGSSKVGKEGDFFTSVSVGWVFGSILAHRIHEEWRRQGSAESFGILEMGANTADLANDILSELNTTFPRLYESCLYHIVEPLESLRSQQRSTTKHHADKLKQYQSLKEVSPFRGIVLSNELIDAFPVQLLEYTSAGWKEKVVSSHPEPATSSSPFHWKHKDITGTELLEFTQNLSKRSAQDFASAHDFPVGYTTEYRPGLCEWVSQLTSLLTEGVILTIDYGYTASAYYHPSRVTGTLRTYYEHTAGEDPLIHIGDQDITAHVDFTQLAKAFHASQYHFLDFTQQSRYLTKHASTWLAKLEKLPANKQRQAIQQFQTLTHPSILGARFFILEVATYSNDHQTELASLLECSGV